MKIPDPLPKRPTPLHGESAVEYGQILREWQAVVDAAEQERGSKDDA